MKTASQYLDCYAYDSPRLKTNKEKKPTHKHVCGIN